jgi:hypothetical protein
MPSTHTTSKQARRAFFGWRSLAPAVAKVANQYDCPASVIAAANVYASRPSPARCQCAASRSYTGDFSLYQMQTEYYFASYAGLNKYGWFPTSCTSAHPVICEVPKARLPCAPSPPPAPPSPNVTSCEWGLQMSPYPLVSGCSKRPASNPIMRLSFVAASRHLQAFQRIVIRCSARATPVLPATSTTRGESHTRKLPPHVAPGAATWLPIRVRRSSCRWGRSPASAEPASKRVAL